MKKKHDANFQVLISDLKSAWKKLYKNHFTSYRGIFFFQKFIIGKQHCATMNPYKLLQWIMWSSVPVVVGIFNLFILVVSDYRRLWLHPVANWLPCDSGMFWHLVQYTMATSVGKKFIQAFCKMVTWPSLWSGAHG